MMSANELVRYCEQMRDFRNWLARRWYHYGMGNKQVPTIRDAAKRFHISHDRVVMMCEDAPAHDFSVSVSANDNTGDRIIELL
jgi:hypothetical protein